MGMLKYRDSTRKISIRGSKIGCLPDFIFAGDAAFLLFKILLSHESNF